MALELANAYWDLRKGFPPSSVEFDDLSPAPTSSAAKSICGRFSVLERHGKIPPTPLFDPRFITLRLPPYPEEPSELLSLIALLLILLFFLRRTYSMMEIPMTATTAKKPTRLPIITAVSLSGDR